ncbi:cupredoxin domain-containing protein [Patescibacteria group bacterium]
MKHLPKLFAGMLSILFVFVLSKEVFAATTNVSITSTGFIPESITIDEGDTILWTNDDTTEHTATDDGLSWDSDIISPGETGSITLIYAGTYTYSDTIDPSLTGTIVVQAASESGATPTPTPATGGTTPTPTPATTPVSGVEGPTIALLMAGALFILGGTYAYKRI